MAEDKKRNEEEGVVEPEAPAAEAAAPDNDTPAKEEAAGGGAEQTGAPSPEEQIEALKRELAETRDQALRTAAEAQNIQKRAEKEAEKARKYAVERFASDLLPVVDNLERALEAGAEDDAAKAVLEGVELTYRSFVDTLERHNLKAINPEGEPFDPQLHEAMSMVEAPDAEPNSVIQVVQKGYTLNDRLLRAAMVVVAKP